ncbi:CRISPR-associated RAMP protein Csx7 [Clostridium sp.]|jgi:CRISPR-associated protein Csm3|uniref:type III CRISPR-associated RAMP protein Csx7 n=1 Tax=Clostridium sp. TaxID=1506 RepID=UPI003A5BD19C
MFKTLYNEAILEFNMETKGPLFIQSGEENPLNPTAADNSYLALYKDGKLVPVIPGTSMKGVFRSRSEKLLGANFYVCNILNIKESCGHKMLRHNKDLSGKERYKKSCAACKLFGSVALKSRIEFDDCYPIDECVIGKRTLVSIDRIKGSAKENALYDFEYVEYGKFKCRIRLKNFFNWHIKLLMKIFQDINDGFVTFGGLTSKGFGRMEVEDLKLKIRYYSNVDNKAYINKGFYREREVEGIKNINYLFKDVTIDENSIQGCELSHEQVL